MRKTRAALQTDERWLQESSFSLSFCLTVLVHQPVRLAALEGQYPDDKDAGAQVASDLFTTFQADTPDGERFSQALNGRFLCFAPISYISPQNPCIFGPIYQFPRFAEIAQLEGMWLIIELQHIGIAIHDENGPEFDFVALKLDGDTL
jgi:hypothetical protein